MFGGEVLGSAERIRQAVTVIGNARRRKLVLVFASSLQGVQATMRRLLPPSTTQEDRVEGLAHIADRHGRLLRDATHGGTDEAFEALRMRYLEEIRHQPPPPSSTERSAWEDRMYAWGERLAAAMLAAALRLSSCDAELHATEKLLFTDGRFGHAHVWHSETECLINAWFLGLSSTAVPVLASGIGADAEGRSTTLGPNGRNITIAIFGNALQAERVEIRSGDNRVQVLDAAPKASDAGTVFSRSIEPERIGATRYDENGLGLPSATVNGSVPRKVDILLAGAGTELGRAFLERIMAGAAGGPLSGTGVRIVAALDNEHMAVDLGGIAPLVLDEVLSAGPSIDHPALQQLLAGSGAHLVDCSKDAGTAALYAPILRDGWEVITANRAALSGPAAGRLRASIERSGNTVQPFASLDGGSTFFAALDDRLQRNDGPLRIEATPSSWINRLLDRMNNGTAFSEALTESLSAAAVAGDAVEELTGREAAAQFTIMLRHCGADIDACDIAVESLLPEEYALHGSLVNILRWARGEDAAWRERVQRAHEQGRSLAYVASADAWYADIRIRAVERDSPLSSSGGRTALSLFTAQHEAVPLSVTAGDSTLYQRSHTLFSDVLRAGVPDIRQQESRQSSRRYPAVPQAEAAHIRVGEAASWTSHAVES
ncbi:MAG: hypothetical protein C0600_10710 [Ignavibacteria bacterium]|nr:MAG: hypothetical protein C0600_10710 [Ignavibacteria bacterium]